MSLDLLARAVADAAAYLSGMPTAPVPLERTDRAPWVWVSAQALRSRVDPAALADAVSSHPAAASVTARPDGWLVLTLAPAWVACTLADLAAGRGMPSAHLPAPPTGNPVVGFEVAEVDVAEAALAGFEMARTAGGAPGLPPAVLARRTLEHPGVVVLLAHARACRVADQAKAVQAEGAVPDPTLGELDDPLDLALLTEILDAPRRLAATGPAETAAALLAVATAYLPWEEHCPAVQTRPGEATTSHHLARQAVSAAGRGVLERGMALLGITAPARM